MITLDTSAVYALLNRRDPDHRRIVESFRASQGPYLLPAGILAEIAYLLESRLGQAALDTFLDDLITGAFSLECDQEDLPRIRDLVRRYADLPLGLADASVVACGERTGGLVLSLDERHFRVVEREGKIRVLP